MRPLSLAFGALLIGAVVASAQQAGSPASSKIGYPTVAAALDGLRAKSGAKVAVQSGWTVIEEPSIMTMWSFTPAGHPAHPAAIRRVIAQKGDDIFVEMEALCEAAKSACEKLLTEFRELNEQMRASLNPKRSR